MDLKKNASLIIGLSIPVIMIIFVAASIYIPSLLSDPQYDFLYMTNEYPYGRWQYEVRDGTLTRTEIDRPDNYRPPLIEEPQFFIHETATDTNRELTFEEASELMLDSRHLSPDGYEFVRGGYDGGLFSLFSGRSDRSYYLRGDGVRSRITLSYGNPNNYYDVRFLGWLPQ